jgi:hypothetical protein
MEFLITWAMALATGLGVIALIYALIRVLTWIAQAHEWMDEHWGNGWSTSVFVGWVTLLLALLITVVRYEP